MTTIPQAQEKTGESIPRFKLWVERDGHVAMSDYRVRLLELVGEAGSLVPAAADLGLSYRRAWGKVKELEATLGIPLVASHAGGKRGGESLLTPEGIALVLAYRRFQERVARETAAAFEAELAHLLAPSDTPGAYGSGEGRGEGSSVVPAPA
jgi:molybdate transport system regulatory protein